MTVRPPITRRKKKRKIRSSLKTTISILTKKLTLVQILIKKLNLMKLKTTMSNYRLFKTYSYSGFVKVIAKYVACMNISSRSFTFQKLLKYVLLLPLTLKNS